jgi:hypothetical protein
MSNGISAVLTGATKCRGILIKPEIPVGRQTDKHCVKNTIEKALFQTEWVGGKK